MMILGRPGGGVICRRWCCGIETTRLSSAHTRNPHRNLDLQGASLRNCLRSQVMWSIGNEIPMRFTKTGGNLSGVMTEMVHAMNPGSL